MTPGLQLSPSAISQYTASTLDTGFECEEYHLFRDCLLFDDDIDIASATFLYTPRADVLMMVPPLRPLTPRSIITDISAIIRDD